jgi:Mg2+ and Co2+ transporter CorA
MSTLTSHLSQKIDSTIAATDALTMIRLSRASAADSSTMKAITILTMVFLPATFVCSLFSMGFFEFVEDPTNGAGNGRAVGPRLHVAGQFWIYFAVAVPLTVVVLGVCAAWLMWSGRRNDDGGGDVSASRPGEGKRWQ